MMASPEVIILDVGHGNCSIIRSEGTVCVVDAPPGSTLLETLSQQGIRSIDTIIVSHADKDHVAGICALLTSGEVAVKLVYVNPDATKKGARSPWHKFRVAVEVASKQGNVKVVTSLTTGAPQQIAVGSVTLDVLAPSPALIMGGAGSTSTDGKTKLTTNSVSAVIRVNYKGEGMFLLPGDIDDVGLACMNSDGQDAKSRVLVFPHHGGHPGNSTPEDFTNLLCQLVQPKLVFISHGRDQFSNPRPEIVAGIRSVSDATIACTQLSKNCLANNVGVAAGHLHNLPAKGKSNSSCCAGSIRFGLDDVVTENFATLAQHGNFVSNHVPQSLCKSGSPA